MADTQRYRDGERWTDHIAPGVPASHQPVLARHQPDDHSGLVTAGILTAIFLPLIGFIIGIVLVAKNKVGIGIGCMILAILAFAFWYNVLAPDPAPTYYYGN